MSTDISIDNMMQKALEIPGLLSLAAGFTDNRLLPRAEVQQVVTELLATVEQAETLQYGLPVGRALLRRQMQERLAGHDVSCGGEAGPATPDDIIITNGSQQALFLAVQALASPGDIFLVDDPTYFVFLDVLRTLGVEARALPSRDDTLDVEALPAYFAALRSSGELARVRGVYVISYFSNPSALSLTTAQKRGLVDAMRAAELHVPVLEDIAYREFYFDEPHLAPSMASLDSPEIPVLVTGTLTKLFSTGIRVGWLSVTEPALRQRLIDLKRCQDFGTSNFVQAVMERVVGDGTLDRYLARVRPQYGAKCHALHQALVDEGLPELGWTWQESRGSLYLWLTAPEGTSTVPDSPLARACMDEKVIYVPGSLCCVSGGERKVRLSFGALDEADCAEAARRFVRAARRV